MENTPQQLNETAQTTAIALRKPVEKRNAGSRISRMGGRADFAALETALKPLSDDPSKSCSEQVLDVLRDAIICARILPGVPLSEVAVATVLGVSRTPVREALRRLAQEDLVRVYPQAATVISPLNLHFLEEGCFIRRSLECANVEDLAQEISTRDLRELTRLIEAQGAAIHNGPVGDFFRLDEAMHQHLFEIADRTLAWSHIQQVKQHFDRVRWLVNRDPRHAERAYHEHLVILDRMKAGDGKGAAKAMFDHISAIAQDLQELRDTAPDNFFEA